MYTQLGIHVGLLAVSSAVTGVLAVYSLRNRRLPSAGAFGALMAAFSLYSASHLIGIFTAGMALRLFWENTQWVVAAAIPVVWLVFAIEYTGYDEMLSLRTVGSASVIPFVTVVLVWTNPLHGLVWSRNTVESVGGLTILNQSFGPWFWVFTVYAYVLVLAGSVLLLRLVWLSDRLYFDQSALLVVGIAAPLLANVLTVGGVSPIREPALDMTPYAFLVSGVAFGYAVFRRQLFDFLPATRQLGRRTAIAQLWDGVVIVDAAQRIVYLNAAAADVFALDTESALGRPFEALLGPDAIAFESEMTTTTVPHDGRSYEVRSSPIYGRGDRPVGHTVVLRDVTTRKEYERQLLEQRDELETLDQLNAAIRGVNGTLVSATTREGIERALCDGLLGVDRYGTVRVADAATWRGDADQWTVASVEDDPRGLPAPRQGVFDPDDRPAIATTTPGHGGGTWIVVPIEHGSTVYGAVALFTDREAIPERELEVLAELGVFVGRAIDGLENRRLLAAESVVELDFTSVDDGSVLAAASDRFDCRLEVTGIIPGGPDIAYMRVEGVPAERVAEFLRTLVDGSVRAVRSDEEGGLIEWGTTDDALLGVFADRETKVLEAVAENGTVRIATEVASDADVRELIDRVTTQFPETQLEAKRECERPVGRGNSISEGTVQKLTDRQREAIEAAYRAGYFDWPRESTAEEVADALGITAPTLHGHLRKAEATLLADVFDGKPPNPED